MFNIFLLFSSIIATPDIPQSLSSTTQFEIVQQTSVASHVSWYDRAYKRTKDILSNAAKNTLLQGALATATIYGAYYTANNTIWAHNDEPLPCLPLSAGADSIISNSALIPHISTLSDMAIGFLSSGLTKNALPAMIALLHTQYVKIGASSPPTAPAHSADTIAYVSSGTMLNLVDVSNPTNPYLIDNYPFWSIDLTASGTTVYVVTNVITNLPTGMSIISAANPSNPTLLGSIGLDIPGSGPISGASIVKVGNTLYVMRPFGEELYIIDVSNSYQPTLLANYTVPGIDASGITVEGTIAYIASNEGYASLAIVDVSNPASPNLLSTYGAGGGLSDVKVLGTTVYLAMVEGTLHTVDASDPKNPIPLGQYNIGPLCNTNLMVSGSLAYIILNEGQEFCRVLQLIDISNPAHPSWIANYTTGSGINAIGEVFFTSNGPVLPILTDSGSGSSLQLINVADPNNPLLSGSINNLEGIGGVKVAIASGNDLSKISRKGTNFEKDININA